LKATNAALQAQIPSNTAPEAFALSLTPTDAMRQAAREDARRRSSAANQMLDASAAAVASVDGTLPWPPGPAEVVEAASARISMEMAPLEIAPRLSVVGGAGQAARLSGAVVGWPSAMTTLPTPAAMAEEPVFQSSSRGANPDSGNGFSPGALPRLALDQVNNAAVADVVRLSVTSGTAVGPVRTSSAAEQSLRSSVISGEEAFNAAVQEGMAAGGSSSYAAGAAAAEALLLENVGGDSASYLRLSGGLEDAEKSLTLDSTTGEVSSVAIPTPRSMPYSRDGRDDQLQDLLHDVYDKICVCSDRLKENRSDPQTGDADNSEAEETPKPETLEEIEWLRRALVGMHQHLQSAQARTRALETQCQTYESQMQRLIRDGGDSVGVPAAAPPNFNSLSGPPRSPRSPPSTNSPWRGIRDDREISATVPAAGRPGGSARFIAPAPMMAKTVTQPASYAMAPGWVGTPGVPRELSPTRRVPTQPPIFNVPGATAGAVTPRMPVPSAGWMASGATSSTTAASSNRGAQAVYAGGVASAPLVVEMASAMRAPLVLEQAPASSAYRQASPPPQRMVSVGSSPSAVQQRPASMGYVSPGPQRMFSQPSSIPGGSSTPAAPLPQGFPANFNFMTL